MQNSIQRSQMNEQESVTFRQACDLINFGIQNYQIKKYPLAKMILVNISTELIRMLKNNELSLQESTLAQQQLTVAIKYAEDCKKQLEFLQQQLISQDPHMKQIIENLLIQKSGVTFNDIAGLTSTKKILYESIILPNLRPDIFSGIRAPHKGILFYGPPGNGKTMLAKAIATESKCSFFNLSASTLVQKYMGEGEKTMKCLFKAAAYYQPCIIFIDEIDSILSTRSEGEHEASRRLKTEFLIQFDGIQTSDQERIVLIGATNRPQEIDHAALRRFVRYLFNLFIETQRIYIDQPDQEARLQLVKHLLKDLKHNLQLQDFNKLVDKLKGYSASDIKSLVKEACMEPVRNEIQRNMILTVNKNDIREVQMKDFEKALNTIKPTLNFAQLQEYSKMDTSQNLQKKK